MTNINDINNPTSYDITVTKEGEFTIYPKQDIDNPLVKRTFDYLSDKMRDSNNINGKGKVIETDSGLCLQGTLAAGASADCLARLLNQSLTAVNSPAFYVKPEPVVESPEPVVGGVEIASPQVQLNRSQDISSKANSTKPVVLSR